MLRADDETLVLKAATERQEQSIRDARRALDAIRALAAELDVSRATAEAELTHLAQQSLDAVQADLDTVAADVAEMERQGIMAPDARAIRSAVAEAGRATTSTASTPRRSPWSAVAAGRATPWPDGRRGDDRRRGHRRTARADRPARSGEHDGDPAVRRAGRARARSSPRSARIWSIRSPRPTKRSSASTKPPTPGSATRSRPSTRISSRPSPRSSAAAAPA